MTKENDARIPKPEKMVIPKMIRTEDSLIVSYNRCYNQAIDEYEKYHDQEMNELIDTNLMLQGELNHCKREIQREQQKCMEDVCMFCGGRCPQWEKQVSGKPNRAGNYIHKRKDRTANALCAATSIVSRSKAQTERMEINIESKKITNNEIRETILSMHKAVKKMRSKRMRGEGE